MKPWKSLTQQGMREDVSRKAKRGQRRKRGHSTFR
jgi:hypothetical protein